MYAGGASVASRATFDTGGSGLGEEELVVTADGPGGRLDLLGRSLVESLDQVHVFVPRPTFQGLACLNGISIPIEGIIDSILLFLSELVDAGQRALCIAEIRNPVAAVQTYGPSG